MLKRFGPMVIAAFFLGLVPVVGYCELKVGFVNAARVIEDAPQAEDARQSLEREFAPRDRKLVALQKSVKQQEERLSRDAAVMSEGERSKLERDIRQKRRELKRSRDELQEDFNIRRNDILAQLQRQALEAIQTLARRESYDLILSDGVMYASERIDITNAILDQMRRDFEREKAKQKPNE